MTTGFLGDKIRENELAHALAQNLEVSQLESTSNIVNETTEAKVDNTLASVIVTLVKCAEQLEALGHPSAGSVDNVLNFIERNFLTVKADNQGIPTMFEPGGSEHGAPTPNQMAQQGGGQHGIPASSESERRALLNKSIAAGKAVQDAVDAYYSSDTNGNPELARKRKEDIRRAEQAHNIASQEYIEAYKRVKY